MRYGIVLSAGDPREAAELAALAEGTGWDGVFTFDAIAIGGMQLNDPWIVLAAAAMRTERVTLGAAVFAPARRRPWKLAREAITLDILSNGRLVVPVGIGAIDDLGFANVGEPVDKRTRAELMDETLAILEGLQTGEPFEFSGNHYRFGPMNLESRPVQRPRIPVWVVGAWPHERSMRRAARWDGIYVQLSATDGVTPDMATALPEIVAWIGRERPAELRGRPYDVVVEGTTPVGDPAAAASATRRLAAAGATWWLEADWDRPTVEGLRARIEAGPPRH